MVDRPSHRRTLMQSFPPIRSVRATVALGFGEKHRDRVTLYFLLRCHRGRGGENGLVNVRPPPPRGVPSRGRGEFERRV